ncbi:uncharacterized protein LOC112017364 [Quercus suber]|uniref:uncharacterized protein LOC112017364 n=1 Tax=Quercus suber TaxID=58331 RepID=UPI000CE1E72A|nr:uncharacterized protein LOC112017364 [Quercus suber]
MKRYMEEVKNRISSLKVRFIQIPREENECADRLVKAASVEFMLVPEQVLSFVQVSSPINDETNVQEVDSESNWTTPLISYLRTSALPDGKDATRKLKVQWVEVEALTIIMEKNIRSFVWRNIFCKYGIPRVLVSDNRKQFDNSTFRDFCLELGIKNHYSSPAHLQANGQVEVMN